MRIDLSKRLYNLLRKEPYRLIHGWQDYENRKIDERVESLNLTEFNQPKIEEIINVLEKVNHASFKTPIRQCKKWLEVLKDPLNTSVGSVSGFKTVMETYVKKTKSGYIYSLNEDGNYMPYCIEEVKATRDDDDGYYVYIGTKYIGTSLERDEWSSRGKSFEEKTKHFYFYGDAFDEKLSLIDILSKQNLHIETQEYIDNYADQIEDFKTLINKGQNKQYRGIGSALVSDGNSWWNRNRWISIDSNVILDAIPDELKRKATISGKKRRIPIHPYFKCFDLQTHKWCLLHPNSLEDYEYSKEQMDKLVLDQDLKDTLNKVLASEAKFNDIIANKGKAMIVLSTGVPGVGKTLTAEVYSEYHEMPLYKVQASSLGSKPEDIEKNLKITLERAYNWNAVLLIDEADTYVMQRGTDLVQNVIVGIFLRLLEYYNGVLFMTSNRVDEIDNAIRSRSTLVINYQLPNDNQRHEIYKILLKQNEFEYDDKELVKILPSSNGDSGRDIKNIIHKLILLDLPLNLKNVEKVKKYM